MRLSERIGYVLEHVLCVLLTRRGIAVRRSEQPDGETIKSDLTFRWKRRNYIVFVTHTRTTGMTNRKFFRTFEELAQRRARAPGAYCVEVSLLSETTHVRNQYGLIFRALFDASISVISKETQPSFVKFVEELGSPTAYETTLEQISELPLKVLRQFEKSVDKILNAHSVGTSLVQQYWSAESHVKAGASSLADTNGSSIKRGIRLLSLFPTDICSVDDIARGAVSMKSTRSASELQHWKQLSICSEARKSLTGIHITFGDEVKEAARVCTKLGVNPTSALYEEYFTTAGSKNLYASLKRPDGLRSDYNRAVQKLQTCQSLAELRKAFLEDFEADTLRCDFIDLAIWSADSSQNEVALDLAPRLAALGEGAPPPDMVVRFVIGKNAGLSVLVSDCANVVKAMADIVWARLESVRRVPDWEDYFSSRLGTFLSHPYVHVEKLMIDQLLSGSVDLGRRRQSVLPRICGLPSKYHMGVEATYHVALGGKRFFIKSVSTPEERHHKHKEFSGKLRTIRYVLDEQGRLASDMCRFVLILDGHWTENQVAMLVNAGWMVFGWDEFLDWLPSEVGDLQGTRAGGAALTAV